MKRAHKNLVVGGIIASITGAIGTIVGNMFLDKQSTLRKTLTSSIAGDDDMGAENDDPIINVARTL
jgi:hypothetical protein